MEEQQTTVLPPEYQGLTFEKVWAMFQETDRKMQETARQMRETDRQMQETGRKMRETDRRIGELCNRFGELAEHLVAPNIRKKFNALHYTFDKISQNIDISDAQDRYSGAEIDILLENGEIAIAVEVKAKPLYKDVDRHLERMEVLRRWADRHNDKRKFLGAVAGAIMPKEVRNYVIKAGFYVIEQTGDTVTINVPEGFKPREW
ncbi:MAG: hypothetical protein LBC62_05785 [Treponema sp.]|nr:hypothetical protein [Treponema sp.]